MKPKSKILIIAGSDSSGGAGIQADIKTVTSLGSYAMTAITAVTSQNTSGVFSVVPIQPKEIKKQILVTCKDIRPDALKIGMLHSSKVIDEVLKAVKICKIKKVIIDPVMVAKGGHPLLKDSAVIKLKKIIKISSLVTPNIPEAEILSGMRIVNTNDMIIAAKKLLKLGSKNILIKGGHMKGRKVFDVFLNKSEIKIFINNKIRSKNTHGTGCSLSSAITTYFACGKKIKKSCELGIKYVNEAINNNVNYGTGHGPINHLVSFDLKRGFN